MIKRLLLAAAIAALPAAAAFAHGEEARIAVVFDQVLPNAPGMSLRGVLVEYGPGGASPAHTHPATAFIYATVLQGAIRSAVNGGPARVYRAGESFAELPGDRHSLSRNDSATEPARLLAVFVVATGETVLTTPLPE
ncbi:cupin domain-containing protein [Roseomonas sp. 18066]|uniref:cupin domain-containing protein n=1 Tax=Roseomonas sp. 18066 TaxID=2681412 RepID=UPI00135AC840|nr:cupin domain-containing protein [Roseomonas sp. 18066]